MAASSQVVRCLVQVEHPNLAYLQAPAAPDSFFVWLEHGKTAKSAAGRATLDVHQPVDRKPEDLNPLQLKKLKATSERPAAELPKTKIPAGKDFGPVVEAKVSQPLQEHKPSPVVNFNRR
jgi:hypothetical protein